MADDRRIITGTYIIPKEGNDREESVGTKWIIDTDVDKTLGGKSIVTDINRNQWHNDWTSMDHPSKTSTATITLSPTNQSVYQINDDTNTVKFFYIKNLGTVDDDTHLTISFDSGGDWQTYDATEETDEEWDLITVNWDAHGATSSSDEEWQLYNAGDVDSSGEYWSATTTDWDASTDEWEDYSTRDNDDDWGQALEKWETYSDDTVTHFWNNFSDDTTTDFWQNTGRLWEGPGFAKSAIIPPQGVLYIRSDGTGGDSFTIDKVHIWLGEYPGTEINAVDIEYVIAK